MTKYGAGSGDRTQALSIQGGRKKVTGKKVTEKSHGKKVTGKKVTIIKDQEKIHISVEKCSGT